jgi:hypothetical protein
LPSTRIPYLSPRGERLELTVGGCPIAKMPLAA